MYLRRGDSEILRVTLDPQFAADGSLTATTVLETPTGDVVATAERELEPPPAPEPAGELRLASIRARLISRLEIADPEQEQAYRGGPVRFVWAIGSDSEGEHAIELEIFAVWQSDTGTSLPSRIWDYEVQAVVDDRSLREQIDPNTMVPTFVGLIPVSAALTWAGQRGYQWYRQRRNGPGDESDTDGDGEDESNQRPDPDET